MCPNHLPYNLAFYYMRHIASCVKRQNLWPLQGLRLNHLADSNLGRMRHFRGKKSVQRAKKSTRFARWVREEPLRRSAMRW